MYTVRNKDEKKDVFATQSLLQAEMVAIALALSSLYGTYQAYEVRRESVVLNTITTDTAFAAMQVKMRNLIFNRRVTKQMPFNPDRFTDFAHTKIVEAVMKDKDLDVVREKLYDEVEAYVEYVRAST